jgi:hypothetical protein
LPPALFLLKLNSIVKSLTAILSVLLLVLAQFAPAQATVACASPAMHCSAACRQMPCCAAKTASGSQRAPAVPTSKTGAQNQISLPAPVVVLWTLPDHFTVSFASVAAAPLTAMAAPLYARNCTLLL